MTDQIFDRMRELGEQSLRNQLGLVSHEKECAIRYEHINASVRAMRGDMKRVATGGFSIGILVIAFLVKVVFFS